MCNLLVSLVNFFFIQVLQWSLFQRVQSQQGWLLEHMCPWTVPTAVTLHQTSLGSKEVVESKSPQTPSIGYMRMGLWWSLVSHSPWTARSIGVNWAITMETMLENLPYKSMVSYSCITRSLCRLSASGSSLWTMNVLAMGAVLETLFVTWSVWMNRNWICISDIECTLKRSVKWCLVSCACS